jgi:hypothetical protein
MKVLKRTVKNNFIVKLTHKEMVLVSLSECTAESSKDLNNKLFDKDEYNIDNNARLNVLNDFTDIRNKFRKVLEKVVVF